MNFYKAASCLLAGLLIASSVQPKASYAQSAFEDPAARSGANKGGDFVADTESLDSGNITLGSSSQSVLLFRNDGSKPITVGDISLYPSSNVSASIGQNECVVGPLPAGAVCAISLSVKGLQPGNFRVEALIRHSGRTKLIKSNVTGVVERSEDTTYDVINDLETIPGELAFGSLKESRPLTRSVVLRNVTSKAVAIGDIFIESNEQAGYTLRSDCDTLESGEACIATVTWAPQQRGPATGVLVVEHDGPTGVVSVVLDGTYEPAAASEVSIFPEAVPGKGLLTSSQTEIDFGKDIESTSAITVSLVNVGDEAVILDEIDLANEDNGLEVVENGCVAGLALDPVEACPLTIKWNPVRVGNILDDVKIRHDGARGILVLPVRGEATQTVNKDTQAIDLTVVDPLANVAPISVDDLEEEPAPKAPPKVAKAAPKQNIPQTGSLEGYSITSLGINRAVVSGPGGSRVIFDGQETVIGAVLWRVNIRNSAVEFVNDAGQRILLLFDRSLSSVSQTISTSSNTNSSSSDQSNNTDSDSVN